MSASSASYLNFYESYARKPVDPLNNTPREPGDFRERVARETVRGRYMFFHENIEGYLNRQWRAYTVPRAGAWFLMSYAFLYNSTNVFFKTFSNIESYKRLADHPNYKLLGPFWSYYYLVRPIAWAYISFRLARYTYLLTMRHWAGEDD